MEASSCFMGVGSRLIIFFFFLALSLNGDTFVSSGAFRIALDLCGSSPFPESIHLQSPLVINTTPFGINNIWYHITVLYLDPIRAMRRAYRSQSRFAFAACLSIASIHCSHKRHTASETRTTTKLIAKTGGA